ncbi:hypothetical protein A3Q56_07676 [Intoshia linei]|uniref:Uncharacterized protein n=1 Tax=Intoshia linei TaxID=1819745 RepID=A0A177ARG4_9BILA|nr:hypothetical protein A3Q56_07676 [Intoshia linei]
MNRSNVKIYIQCVEGKDPIKYFGMKVTYADLTANDSKSAFEAISKAVATEYVQSEECKSFPLINAQPIGFPGIGNNLMQSIN